MIGLGGKGTQSWRALLSVVVAYMFAAQSLLIAVGFSLPPDAGPAFELCLHDASGAPDVPASKSDLSDRTHCIFCFAADLDAVIGTAPALFYRIDVTRVVMPRLGDSSAPRLPTRYTIASPRGPPLSA
jgi:hypothetical protein